MVTGIRPQYNLVATDRLYNLPYELLWFGGQELRELQNNYWVSIWMIEEFEPRLRLNSCINILPKDNHHVCFQSQALLKLIKDIAPRDPLDVGCDDASFNSLITAKDIFIQRRAYLKEERHQLILPMAFKTIVRCRGITDARQLIEELRYSQFVFMKSLHCTQEQITEFRFHIMRVYCDYLNRKLPLEPIIHREPLFMRELSTNLAYAWSGDNESA